MQVYFHNSPNNEEGRTTEKKNETHSVIAKRDIRDFFFYQITFYFGLSIATFQSREIHVESIYEWITYFHEGLLYLCST